MKPLYTAFMRPNFKIFQIKGFGNFCLRIRKYLQQNIKWMSIRQLRLLYLFVSEFKKIGEKTMSADGFGFCPNVTVTSSVATLYSV